MTINSTSQTIFTHNSSTQLDEFQAWQKKAMANAAKPQTAAQIRASGEVRVKLGVLWFVGILCSILSAFGGAIFFHNPDIAKDLWVIIGPIITAAVTGTIAFLTGEKVASGK